MHRPHLRQTSTHTGCKTSQHKRAVMRDFFFNSFCLWRENWKTMLNAFRSTNSIFSLYWREVEKRFSMCRNSIFLRMKKKTGKKMSSQDGKQWNENIWNAFSMRFYSLLTHTLLIHTCSVRREGERLRLDVVKRYWPFALMASSLPFFLLSLSLFISTGRLLSDDVCAIQSFVV